MNQTNKEAFNEFARGAAAVIAVMAMIVLTVAVWLPDKPQSDQKFQVVDKYKGCDVVQYAPSTAARYQYFLDCSVNRP